MKAAAAPRLWQGVAGQGAELLLAFTANTAANEDTAEAQVHSKLCACTHLCPTSQRPAPRAARRLTQEIQNNVSAQLRAAGAVAALTAAGTSAAPRK